MAAKNHLKEALLRRPRRQSASIRETEVLEVRAFPTASFTATDIETTRPKSPPVPDVTHLQYGILVTVQNSGEISGADLRESLNLSSGQSYSGPAFYQLMGRLEDAGFLSGKYSIKQVNGTPVRERRYQIEELGRDAISRVETFYDHFGDTVSRSHHRQASASKLGDHSKSAVVPKNGRVVKKTIRPQRASIRRRAVADTI